MVQSDERSVGTCNSTCTRYVHGTHIKQHFRRPTTKDKDLPARVRRVRPRPCQTPLSRHFYKTYSHDLTVKYPVQPTRFFFYQWVISCSLTSNEKVPSRTQLNCCGQYNESTFNSEIIDISKPIITCTAFRNRSIIAVTPCNESLLFGWLGRTGWKFLAMAYHQAQHYF